MLIIILAKLHKAASVPVAGSSSSIFFFSLSLLSASAAISFFFLFFFLLITCFGFGTSAGSCLPWTLTLLPALTQEDACKYVFVVHFVLVFLLLLFLLCCLCPFDLRPSFKSGTH